MNTNVPVTVSDGAQTIVGSIDGFENTEGGYVLRVFVPNAIAREARSADSSDPCPEWNCPDLSQHDLREGKTCPEHPCTCSAD